MRNRAVITILTLILTLGCCVFLFCSCGESGTSGEIHHTQDGKVIIRVSMYNNSSYPEWRAYVEKQCPDIYIEWENNLNNVSNVLYRAEHSDMPDIVCIRRFESDTTSELSKYLMDLSDLDFTKTYIKKYLLPYQQNGRQYWLPGPGNVEGTVANETLFKKYGVPLPDDMDSFISACRQLEEKGITVYDIDMLSPWSATSLLEGFGMEAFFNSKSGYSWLMSFKSGEASSVDKKGFTRIYKVLKRLKNNGILTNEDVNSDNAAVSQRFIAGKSAMIRMGSDELYSAPNDDKCIALPYFGDTPEDSYLFTYPVFSAAISRNAGSSAEYKEAAEKVLNAMLNEDAQKVLNKKSEGLISYNKNVKLKLSPSMSRIKSLIKKNKCFIRSLNSNSFSANNLAVTAMIKDNASAGEFIDILNNNLFIKPSVKDVASSNIEASCEVDSSSNCPGASVIAQTVCGRTGADCAIIDSDESTAPIYKGDYNSKDISAIVAGSPVYTGTVTGSQLKKLLQSCIYYSTTFASGYTEPLIDYPSLGGMKAEIKKNGTVIKIICNGSKTDDSGKYKIAVSGNIYNAMMYENNKLCSLFKADKKNLVQIFTDYFTDKTSLPDPEDYFEVK